MRRWLLIACLLFGPGMLTALTGCHEHKVKIERRSERIEESEPRTVSPGEPVVE